MNDISFENKLYSVKRVYFKTGADWKKKKPVKPKVKH